MILTEQYDYSGVKNVYNYPSSQSKGLLTEINIEGVFD